MSLDPTTIVSSLLGGLIAISGSITVALLYIRSQNKSDRKRRLHEMIQRRYFEEGVLPIEAALSEYGTSAVFAIVDLRTWVGRCLKFGEGKKLLEAKIEEIVKRPTITDITQRNFVLAMKWFPTLQRFGMPLHDSIKRTFQLYSEVLSDILTFRSVQHQVAESSVEEFMRGSSAVGQMIQATEIYLERRLENLKDYVWQKDFENYYDFQKMFQEQKYTNFLSDLKQYFKYLSDWMDALRSEKSEDRKRTSLALSKWLTENTEHNPLQ